MPRPSKREEILDELRKADKDLSIGEITDRAGVTRRTTVTWMQRLKNEGLVKVTREVGQAKLYALTERGENNATKVTTTRTTR